MRYVVNGEAFLAAMLITSKGKTTTTERMLYYSGHTRRIGSMALSLLTISIFIVPHKLLLSFT